jgi:hypothetical protein
MSYFQARFGLARSAYAKVIALAAGRESCHPHLKFCDLIRIECPYRFASFAFLPPLESRQLHAEFQAAAKTVGLL